MTRAIIQKIKFQPVFLIYVKTLGEINILLSSSIYLSTVLKLAKSKHNPVSQSRKQAF